MKLRNRIMSWILSPGAYAVWHSMGNPDEWELWDQDKLLRHKTAGVHLWVGLNDTWILRKIFCAMAFDGEDRWTRDSRGPCIGAFERLIVYRRVAWCGKTLIKRRENKAWYEANRSLFTKLTINQ